MSNRTANVGTAIEDARVAARLSQRALAERSGVSQATLSRIISGNRPAKMTEIISIADATGFTVGQLTGTSATERVQCAARATDGAGMETMRRQLLHFVELEAFLDDHAISAPW